MDHNTAETLLRYQKSLDCIHCGLCLSVCPTYLQTGHELESPRGRIAIMRALAEESLPLDASTRAPLDHCLLCRACESMCPSAVQYGAMMELTRHEIHRQDPGGGLGRFALDHLISHPRRLALAAGLLHLYQRTGLARLARALKLTHLLPPTLQRMEATMPTVPPGRSRRPLKIHYDAKGKKRGRVALLSGCVMPHLFGDVHRQSIEALVAQGYEVVVPATQGCCGALHAHAGDLDGARAAARVNMRAFLDAEVDWVVLNSAGCGAAMKDYVHWFADRPEKAEAVALADRVIDILELFHRENLQPRGEHPVEGPACYDAPCHLHHAQGCQGGPLSVLQRVPGLTLVPLKGSEHCCGAAGTWNITQPEMSDAILKEKLDHLEASGARVLITGNPGCMLQWQRGIEERGLAVKVRHPAAWL